MRQDSTSRLTIAEGHDSNASPSGSVVTLASEGDVVPIVASVDLQDGSMTSGTDCDAGEWCRDCRIEVHGSKPDADVDAHSSCGMDELTPRGRREHADEDEIAARWLLVWRRLFVCTTSVHTLCATLDTLLTVRR